ncbi:MAG: hypothetical protein ABIH20_01980 [Candidatus Diapherotrites archaeon]
MASQQQLGSYAFLVGAAIAIIVGLLVAGGQQSLLGAAAAYVPLVLVILGAIVGFLNVKDKHVNEFLISAIALIVLSATAGGLAEIPAIGIYLAAIVQNIAIFVAPAALIVALKAIKGLASEQVNTL